MHGHHLGVIPSKCANGTILVRCQVEEVYVLRTVVVEVEVDDLLSKIMAAVDCTHVVVELDGTKVLEGSRGK